MKVTTDANTSSYPDIPWGVVNSYFKDEHGNV